VKGVSGIDESHLFVCSYCFLKVSCLLPKVKRRNSTRLKLGGRLAAGAVFQLPIISITQNAG